ncbi:MAG TPA: hypothetical protein VKU44_07290 [Terriglobia bacterium]|nr:hypothetical protein [Terriglobia bacterium]
MADLGGIHQVKLLGEGIFVEEVAELARIDLALAGLRVEGAELEEVVAEAVDVEVPELERSLERSRRGWPWSTVPAQALATWAKLSR